MLVGYVGWFVCVGSCSFLVWVLVFVWMVLSGLLGWVCCVYLVGFNSVVI